MALVELKQVTKNYQMGEMQVRALSNIELQIEQQSFVSFKGPSGSGKTTLLNMIGCLDKPSSGDVYVNGTAVNDFSPKEALYPPTYAFRPCTSRPLTACKVG